MQSFVSSRNEAQNESQSFAGAVERKAETPDDTRNAYLEQWIDSQQMTTSSESDSNYVSSADKPNKSGNDSLCRSLAEYFAAKLFPGNKRQPAKPRKSVQDVEFGRYGPQESEALDHFHFLSETSSVFSDKNSNQVWLQITKLSLLSDVFGIAASLGAESIKRGGILWQLQQRIPDVHHHNHNDSWWRLLQWFVM